MLSYINLVQGAPPGPATAVPAEEEAAAAGPTDEAPMSQARRRRAASRAAPAAAVGRRSDDHSSGSSSESSDEEAGGHGGTPPRESVQRQAAMGRGAPPVGGTAPLHAAVARVRAKGGSPTTPSCVTGRQERLELCMLNAILLSWAR